MTSHKVIYYSTSSSLSIICEVLLLYGFIRLKELRRHPGSLIFWQCVSQLILDIHWFTGIEMLNMNLNSSECQILGAFFVYFYLLSWDYNLLLSIEILIKILYPFHTGYKKRQRFYHGIAHTTSLAVFIILITGNNNGRTPVGTCLVQSNSVYELIPAIPAFIHFPLCCTITIYTFWISYDTFYVRYLKYHMLVVITFSICWVPTSLLYFSDCIGSRILTSEWFPTVTPP